MSMLTWLHLSDFHFSLDKQQKWDESIVLHAMLEDVGRQIEERDATPDFIAVSGDVAFGGAAGEYALAGVFFDALLQTTGLGKDRLLIVPGNHDVNREVVSPSANAVCAAMVDRAALRDALSDNEARRLILRRQDGFAAFVNGYFGDLRRFDDRHGFFVRKFEKAGKSIAVLGLNTAFVAKGGERDRGQLVLGEQQVREALEQARDADLTLAMMHHPFEWLRDFDRYDCEPLLMQGCDFVLHGHLHRAAFSLLKTPDTQAMVIAAGACYETREQPNSYNLVTLDMASDEGVVCLRSYADRQGGFWTKDTATYRNVDNGEYRFSLPGTLGRKSEQRRKAARPQTLSALDREIRDYCNQAKERHGSLPLAGFATKLRVAIHLKDLYVPLRAVVDLRGKGGAEFGDAREAEDCLARGDGGMGSLEISLPEAFYECEKRGKRGFVILGDPGAGKTTHLKRVLLACCQEGSERIGLPAQTVPVFLPLRDLRDLGSGLDAFIQAELDKNPHHGRAADFGRRLLERGRLLFLLDGLDEVADVGNRKQVSGWIGQAMEAYPTCRFAVTCRYAGYSNEVRLDARFMELHIRPLSDEQAEAFVRNWYNAVETQLAPHPASGAAMAEERAEALVTRLREPEFRTRRVYELMANPLLLANLCLVHRDRGKLPRRRVDLYAECVDVLLERWREGKGLCVGVTADTGKRVLQPAALWLHGKENRTKATAEELVPEIEPSLVSVKWPRGTAEAFLRTVRDESGLLTGWGDGTYGFMHLGFQEYLAAREIRVRALSGDKGVLRDLAGRFGESWWQEVTLLLLALEEPSLFEPLMREVLRSNAVLEHGELLDLCLEDAAQVSEAPFVALVQGEPGKDKARWARQLVALRILERMKSGRLDALRTMLRKHPSPEIRSWVQGKAAEKAQEIWVADPGGYELVWIQGGRFEMGSEEYETEQPVHTVEVPREQPVHTVEVPSFYMGRYPVTNEQYARYLEANPGKPKPGYWSDRRYNQPRQPVVGVSWDGARAYCDWAGLRLPSEAEWEYACRAGTGTRYCTGDAEADLNRAGWYRGNAGSRLHAVGEREANPFGLYDMHGNVWEWCEDDWHNSYEDAPEDGRAWVDKPRAGGRVGRGGSWGDGARDCRSAYRRFSRPGGRSVDLGFRPARSFP